MSHRTVVVGAGVTGLVAARALAAAGCDVTILERLRRAGGQVRTVDLAGHRVDVGAEALHLPAPPVGELLDELGLRDGLVTAEAAWTWIWGSRGLRPLPAGVGPAGPTRLAPMVGSRVLGPLGLARAALEPLVPARAIDGDVAVGAFLGRRFGRQVTERLVDPLLGSLHAGDVSGLSLHAATPYLAAAARSRRSLLLGGRGRRTASGAPAFGTFPGGLGTLIDALVDHRSLTLRTGVAVSSLRADRCGVDLDLSDGDRVRADAVVLAVPAHAAAAVLSGRGQGGEPPDVAAEDGASELSALRSASVATVVAAYPRAAVERIRAFRATGLLVPSTEGRFLKAATFLSRKWPHLDDPDVFLVRLSAGRAGGEDVTALPDRVLVERLHRDLATATGLRCEPSLVHVQRWPRSLAQLEVGHLDRLRAIRSALPGGGSVVLAGAPYEGVGLAACIGSGRAAAGQVLSALRSGIGVPA
jgi:oxygen-dependent protoporphyrinogen oxidase